MTAGPLPDEYKLMLCGLQDMLLLKHIEFGLMTHGIIALDCVCNLQNWTWEKVTSK